MYLLFLGVYTLVTMYKETSRVLSLLSLDCACLFNNFMNLTQYGNYAIDIVVYLQIASDIHISIQLSINT